VLLDTLARLVAEEAVGHRVELVILGDGPARGALEARATKMGIGDRIHWLGHVADRPTYLDALATCDVFVFPSPAEGFPKVVLDAMAVGVPVVATRAGALGELIEADLVGPIAATEPGAIARALRDLVAMTPDAVRARREPARAFAAGHTREAELGRLVACWRGWWPDLPGSR
jgi:glycosyltransferase involved in cell wall biosynthesis